MGGGDSGEGGQTLRDVKINLRTRLVIRSSPPVLTPPWLPFKGSEQQRTCSVTVASSNFAGEFCFFFFTCLSLCVASPYPFSLQQVSF